MNKLNGLDWLALVLLIIGGLNWGLIGFFNWNLVSAIFGEMAMVGRVVYAVVGLSALYTIALSMKLSKS